jgi:hypothetical protein
MAARMYNINCSSARHFEAFADIPQELAGKIVSYRKIRKTLSSSWGSLRRDLFILLNKNPVELKQCRLQITNKQKDNKECTT